MHIVTLRATTERNVELKSYKKNENGTHTRIISKYITKL